MKRNRALRRTSVGLCSLILSVISLSCFVGWYQAAACESQNNGLSVGSNTTEVTNHSRLSAKSRRGDTRKPFRVLPVQKPDQVLVVHSDRRTVSLRGKAGRQIWSVDVVEKLKGYIAPEDKIRDVRIDNDRILVTVGKHSFATVDLKSGKVNFLGSD